MKRSSSTKILTTHVGSLPRPDGTDRAGNEDDATIREMVKGVVARQRDVGIDVINEGEYTKGGDWLSYVDNRFGGFEARPPAGGTPVILQGKDREEFADFYRYATQRGSLFYEPAGQIKQARPHWVATAPVTYRGGEALKKEIDIFRSVVGPDSEAFITTTAPASLEPYRRNEYYKTQEEFIFALAEAMRTEYRTIVEAGFILQIDDAWLVALWDRIGIAMGLDAFRRYCEMRIDALNHALRDLPEDRIRYHLCWGSWHGPHAHDIELEKIVDLMLKVRAQGYLIEAANARHEHEYAVWERVKLPAGKILIPGMVSHATDGIEHPELVAQRIRRFARIVGPENVIAGTDCGFGGRTHPQIAWAKLQALAQGAALAGKAGL
ncbi:MAG: cobalamin-independent methionine synthase II family protein [Xanthobacteraceae bacterium]|nr:cobalamin-independent methionine synthase II family protein [Xanthobacteraceae bacterium]